MQKTDELFMRFGVVRLFNSLVSLTEIAQIFNCIAAKV